MNQLDFNYHHEHYPNIPYRQQQTPQQPAQPAQQQPGSNVILPAIDTSTFIESSRAVRDLLSEAANLSNQLINTDIGRDIMDAAQKSDTQAIYRLLRAIGIKSNIRVSYTPHSITVEVSPPNPSNASLQSTVTLNLVWNKAF